MSFKQCKHIYKKISEMNNILSFIKKQEYEIIYGPYTKDPNHPLSKSAFIEDKVSKLYVTTKVGCIPAVYVFDKTAMATKHEVNGLQAFTVLSQYYKVPRVSQEEQLIDSASNKLYSNPKYNGTRQHAYGYDMNSAFSWGMLQDMPKDTDKGPINKTRRIVKPDELGFQVTGELCLPGQSADYIFKSEPSPFKRFVEVWYKRKRTAKNSRDKQYAKDVLNMSVGWMQRANYWLRSAIIGHCNIRMNNLIRKYSDIILFSNTDSIVSTERIPELDSNIGLDVGQWKLEHDGLFAYIGQNSQWDFTLPTYRGTPKGWFKEGYDILKDKRPTCGNLYEFNKEKLRLLKVKED